MNRQIKEVMTPMPHTIGFDISVEKAMEMMKEFNCRHLPVLNGGKLVGVLSERDLKVLEVAGATENIPVENLMTEEPISVGPDETVKEVIQKMLKDQIGSVIVSAKPGQPWGIFTTTDALKLLIETI